jgi:hypothetical protein
VKGPAALSSLERARPEAVAVAVLGPHPDEIADRADRIISRSRIPASLDFGEKPCRVLDLNGQFDPLALAVGVSSGIPIIVGVGLSAFLRMVLVSTPSGNATPASLFLAKSQRSTHAASVVSNAVRPESLRSTSQRQPGVPEGSLSLDGGGLPSPIDPKCLSKLTIRPLRFPGRRRPASDRPEAGCPSCALSFELTGGCSSCRGRGRACVFADRENVGRVDHPEHHAQARPKMERRLCTHRKIGARGRTKKKEAVRDI